MDKLLISPKLMTTKISNSHGQMEKTSDNRILHDGTILERYLNLKCF